MSDFEISHVRVAEIASTRPLHFCDASHTQRPVRGQDGVRSSPCPGRRQNFPGAPETVRQISFAVHLRIAFQRRADAFPGTGHRKALVRPNVSGGETGFFRGQRIFRRRRIPFEVLRKARGRLRRRGFSCADGRLQRPDAVVDVSRIFAARGLGRADRRIRRSAHAMLGQSETLSGSPVRDERTLPFFEVAGRVPAFLFL